MIRVEQDRRRHRLMAPEISTSLVDLPPLSRVDGEEKYGSTMSRWRRRFLSGEVTGGLPWGGGTQSLRTLPGWDSNESVLMSNTALNLGACWIREP